MAFILYTAAVLLLSIKSTSGICPQNCSCDNEYQLAVNCDDVKLRYLPPLLHPGTQFLRLSKCQIEQLDLDVMELYPGKFSETCLRYFNIVVIASPTKCTNYLFLGKSAFLASLRMYLDLSSNRLQRIESNALEDLGELLELNLSYNLLNNFSFEIFTGLINLQKLRIAGNQITRFDDSPLSKTLPNLRNIDLSQNMITSIPSDTFLGLKLIKAIDLSSNLLKEIPTFDQNNLVNLKYLNMNFNKLREITPHSFRQLLSLLELDLARNEFSVLSASAFDGLFHLKELKLSEQMYLRKIQNGAFSGLASLEVLNLSHSQILEYIDENAFEVSHALRTFDASYCSLKTFPSGLFDWKRVTELRLHGNPLHCDHKLLSFLPDILRLRSIHNVICASPNDLYNISISALVSVCIIALNDWTLSM
uniref:LRRNT domain-containing protein n=1 Tax=Setaria digitata TaxID=48799 RepID=A0A915Q0Q8_9BILA